MSSSRRGFSWRSPVACVVLGGWLLTAAPGRAEEKLPASYQALLFKKIFHYDRTLKAISEVQVGILTEGATGSASEALVAAFAGQGIAALAIDRLGGEVPAVVYVSRPRAAVRGYCEQHKVLSVGAGAWLAEAGEVAIALGRRSDGKVEIVVNLARLRAEGHELGADLLALARVIR